MVILAPLTGVIQVIVSGSTAILKFLEVDCCSESVAVTVKL
jgi:hypothetical protein